MARRRKSTDDGGLAAIAYCLMFALSAIAQFIKPILVFLVNALALLGLPALLLLRHIYLQKRDAALNKQVPDPTKFYWDDDKLIIDKFSRSIADVESKIRNIYEYAKQIDLRLTDASGGHRFDQRRKEGVGLNNKLDELETHTQNLYSMRDNVRKTVLRRVPAWQHTHDTIINSVAAFGAVQLSLWVYSFVFILLLVLRPSWVQSLSLLAIPMPGSFHIVFGPASLATVAAGLAYLPIRAYLVSRLNKILHTKEVREWRRIESEIHLR